MTAVEWLVNELYTKIEMIGDGNLFDKILNKAKEMEKQQIMNAYNERAYDIESFDDSPEEYYNNTYKK